LTEDKIAYFRHFALKIESHMTNNTFEMLEFAFPKLPFESYKLTKAHAKFLSQFKPISYDCCILSCCFVGLHADLDQCPYCNEPQYNSMCQLWKCFTYVPFIPRLKAFYKSPSLNIASSMHYQVEFKHKDGIIQDIMDSSHYWKLKDTGLC
jgi:hypothetical protein